MVNGAIRLRVVVPTLVDSVCHSVLIENSVVLTVKVHSPSNLVTVSRVLDCSVPSSSYHVVRLVRVDLKRIRW